VIPESYDPDPDRYGSGRRGELPVGWGITPATAVLMPAIWDHYATTATGGDELVDMMGLGYALPSLFPDGVDFLADGNRLRASLGVDTHWTLDALISKPEDRGWADVNAADARSGLPPAGVLLNYDSWPGPAWYRTAPGVPVLTARKNDYSAGPAELAATLTTLLHTPPAQRPLVNFFAATVWSSSYDGLADAMRPLAAQGVRFLTPRQAFACLPPAKVLPGSTTTASTPSTTAASSTTTGPSPTVPQATGAGSLAGVPTFTG
jgi:hypothetical protein